MTGHAKLSPSAAHRWLYCTASPSLEARYKDPGSTYAAEGTEAHAFAELSASYAIGLLSDYEYDMKFEELTNMSEYFNAEMDEAAGVYAEYVKEKLFEARKSCGDAFSELEVKLDLTDYIPEGFGTADCIIVAEPEMWVIDFKYGKGVAVEAEGNPQMEIYALGALAKYETLYDISKVNMAIVQPRLGGISEASMDREALRAWASIKIVPTAKEAYEGPGAFSPGEETCRFCKAKGDCQARANYFVDLFEENDPLTDTMPPEQIGELLYKAQGMKAWLSDLEERALGLLMSGTSVEGWKLVAGKSNRTWSDEAKVAEILKTKGRLKASEIYTKKLNGITQIEKVLGKKKFAEILPMGELVIKPEGKPTLAKVSDKRPEISPADTIVKAFDE